MNALARAVTRTALIVVAACGLTGGAAAGPDEPASASPAAVQETWLRRGAPIRARIDSQRAWTRGTFDHVGGDSLFLWEGVGVAGRRLVPIALPTIRRLELGREREPRTWRGFAIGFLVAGAAGAVAVAADPEVDNEAGGALLGLAIFGPLGGLVGSILGSSVQHDHWVAASVPDAPGLEEGRAPEAGDRQRDMARGGER